VNSTSTSEVTATFTLPAARVLESLEIASGSDGSEVVASVERRDAERSRAGRKDSGGAPLF